MKWRCSSELLSHLRRFPATSTSTPPHHHYHHQFRSLVRVRLKWVKNKSLDHIIDTHTDLKAASLLKDAIHRSSVGYVTSKSISEWQKHLGLSIPTVRFVRRYPTLFQEFPHPKYHSLPCFRLTNIALNLHNQEQLVFQTHEADLVERLSKVLMMTKNKMLPFQSLYPLRWDLGLPDDFDRNLIRRYPDCFQVVKGFNGLACLKLVNWNDEFAVSELQKANEIGDSGDAGIDESEFRKFKSGKSALAFSMSFPRGYGEQKKVKAWMDGFQKLPYISPYEDSRGIDPNSDLMEKRVVGLLHELLSLTVYKKTQRNYLRSLREELNLSHKFTRYFTRYPGIFYLSLKCKTTTVVLREGYRRGKLVAPTPLSQLREKFYYVMRTGLIYRNKGVDKLPQLDRLVTDDEEDVKDDYESEEVDNEMSEECYMDGSSESDGGSSQED